MKLELQRLLGGQKVCRSVGKKGSLVDRRTKAQYEARSEVVYRSAAAFRAEFGAEWQFRQADI